MGVSYSHYIFSKNHSALSSSKAASFLKELQEFGLLDNEEMEITNNLLPKTQTWRTTVQRFINGEYQSIPNENYLLRINLMKSTGNPNRYARVFNKETFEIDRVEDLYASELLIISSTAAILPVSEQLLDIGKSGKSIYRDFDSDSESIEKSQGRFKFLPAKTTKIQVSTYPFIHYTKGILENDLLLRYQHGYTGEELEFTCPPFHFGVCFDMNKCLPKIGLNHLELHQEFTQLLGKIGILKFREFASFH